jgi:formylglycine-generating enzyme required for sulfatase activity/serine/threonine protein phosphatase PrpC
MALNFELSGAQIDGAREYQEDAFLITNLTDKNGNPAALIIVADGMGGHAAGNVASNMAVQAFNKHVSANYPSDDLPDVLQEAVLRANKAIKDTVAETPALQGMGCTMVAGILEAGKIYWASVGDSHLYVVRGSELMKKNADHSYGGFLERMKAAGTPMEPEPGLAPNMLMSAITGDDINEIDVPTQPFELQPGDRVLLCSDGMDTLSDGKIIQYSAWSDSPKECGDALLQAVTDAKKPKQDNTTVVVVKVVEKAAAAQAAPPPPAPVAAPAPAPQAAVAAPAAVSAPPEREEKSKSGLIIGIAAAVIIAAGVGAFFAMSGKKPAAPATESAPTSEEVAGAEGTTEGDAGSTEEQAPGAETESPATEEAAAPATGETAAPAAETAAAPAATPAAAPATTSAAPASGEFQDTLKAGGAGPAMVWIPAGTFEMGSSGSSRNTEERPRHTVKVDRFAISKYEVTFAEYEKFAAAAGRKLPDNLYLDKATSPVFFVTWDDAFYYTKWLSEQTGHKYRLPSEAEWEYAAGAGKTSPFWWGFEEEPNRGHCFGCGTSFDPRKPTKVGSFGPNPFGVHDTAGNVAEWVADCWHETYNGAPTDGGVWEGGDCVYRIARGGAFSSPPESIRHAKRDRYKSDQMYDHIGIRLVREE